MKANKAVVGVDIGTQSVKVVSLAGSGRPKIIAFAEVEAPLGSIGGQSVNDKDTLSISIKKAIDNAQPHKIRPHFVCTALPEHSVFTKVVTLPKLKKNEFQMALREEINQVLPKAPEDMEVDYQILGENEGNIDVLAVAADKKLVSDVVETLTLVGLDVLRLETKPLALGRLIIGHSVEPTVLVDIGARGSSISVYDWGQLRVTATVPVGGDQWKDVISQHEKGQPAPAAEAKAFIPTISTIIEEVMNALHYYQNRSISARPVTKVILAGGGSQLGGIVELFQDKINIPAQLASPVVKLLEGMDNRYYTAIGCAIDPPL